MRIALYNRVFEPTDIPFFQQLIALLQAQRFEIVLYKDFYERLQSSMELHFTPALFTSHKDLNQDVDLMLSLGGDGTMLDTVCFVHDSDIPTLGVNLGRLGFLADVNQHEIAFAIKALALGSYSIEKRSLIHLDSSESLFGDYPFALNEFTLHRKDSSSMIKIHTFLNGDFLNTYWADGLIVATPTGSTGYSLSCSGPLVFPTAGNFILTPVAPHNLNIRPIIVPDDTIISFEVEGRTDQFLCTLDSRVATITSKVQLAIKKERFGLNLIRLDEHNFLNTIRKKLYWGIDTRN
ncbi:NAD kinase [Taibaiella sp. KBW10]|uniref:NAD kinase n=1 Tax=Taibaiella sp. KBW10 TaxID=2153357 RepID=UPI000F5B0CE4|nr:NAD kinase [Taibaiella sp. KBW10]RQO31098.1 NAD kinase [Taibaiella sp. KBW10]